MMKPVMDYQKHFPSMFAAHRYGSFINFRLFSAVLPGYRIGTALEKGRKHNQPMVFFRDNLPMPAIRK